MEVEETKRGQIYGEVYTQCNDVMVEVGTGY